MIPEDVTQLDPKVVKVMSTIKKLESGGDYNAVGDNGTSKGAYQWQPSNFQNAAKEHGLDPSDFSPANQNKVAYAQIKAYKDAGRTPEEIDALWNGAHQDKSTGTYVHNNPERAKKFRETILSKQSISSPDTTKQQQEQNQPGLGQELINRGSDIGNAVKETLQGKINPVSGLLQTVGGVAGGVGDIVNKGIEQVPGVKKIEGLIGKGVGKLAQTETGQKVAKGITDFTTKHPELSADIGSVVNIATALPILKGVGVVGNLVKDASSSALKGVAEKVAIRDLTEVLTKTVGGRKSLETAPEAVAILIKERALPEIIDNKYSVKEAFQKIGKQISEIENKEYQPALEKAVSGQGVQTSYFPMKQVEANALEVAKNELKDPTPIKAYFERLRAKYGETPNIAQLNKAKRIVSKNISEAGFNSPTYSTDKIVRTALQKSVEDGAKALGVPNIDAINQKMADLIKTQNVLRYIEGKPIKTGVVGETIKNVATVGGEMAGSSTGIPIAGTLAGRQAGGFVGKKLSGVTRGILSRTGKDAERVTAQELKKKLGGLFTGAAIQKVTNRK